MENPHFLFCGMFYLLKLMHASDMYNIRYLSCFVCILLLCLKKYYLSMLKTLRRIAFLLQIGGWWKALSQEEKSNVGLVVFVKLWNVFLNHVEREFISLFIFIFQVLSYLSLNEGDDISWALIQRALGSVSQTAIIPMQDVLGLGSSARMNIPATQVKCYAWCSFCSGNILVYSTWTKKIKMLEDLTSGQF